VSIFVNHKIQNLKYFISNFRYLFPRDIHYVIITVQYCYTYKPFKSLRDAEDRTYVPLSQVFSQVNMMDVIINLISSIFELPTMFPFLCVDISKKRLYVTKEAINLKVSKEISAKTEILRIIVRPNDWNLLRKSLYINRDVKKQFVPRK